MGSIGNLCVFFNSTFWLAVWQFGEHKTQNWDDEKTTFFYTGYVVRDTQAPDIYVSACHLKKRWQHKEEIHALLVLTSSAEKHPSLKRVKRGRRRKKMMITYESWHTVEWFVLIIQLFVDVLVVIAQFASQFMDQLFENNRVYVLPQHVE